MAKATPDGTRESAPKAWDEYHLINRLQETDEIAASMAFFTVGRRLRSNRPRSVCRGRLSGDGAGGHWKDANFAEASDREAAMAKYIDLTAEMFNGAPTMAMDEN